MSPFLVRISTLVAQAAFGVALAVATVPGALADDLPSRVGRLADLGGRVYLATEERAGDWVEALRNYTVTSGDNLWVTEEGRAEVDYGGGQFRLAGDSNVHVARLDDRILALFVAHGRVIVRIRVLEPGEEAHIDTPNTQLVLTRPGLYRIDVSEARTSLVVREGEATMAARGGIQQVLPGQTALAEGAEPSYADVRNGYASDGFDSWSANRDRRYQRSRTASYVSRQMIGYVDLDEYGRWDSSPEYGAIWYPTAVAVDWAPYRHGRWSWVAGFGWTWVDDAPWGYAPFHYGRWVYVGNRWGWCPGGYVARPAWAPALVGWYGGSGWSASLSFGAPVYGWVPLAWGEPYIPSWRCSDRCWTRYNRPYAVNYAERPSAPPTRYVNWSAPGGVTAVAGATFTGRQPVQRNLVAVRPAVVASAPVLAQAPVLAKPTAATIPGAKPAIGRAPAPAEHFYRTKPMTAAPTWGGGSASPSGATSAPPALRSAPVPSAPTAVRPAPVPSAPTAVRPAPATSAPPAGVRVAPAQPAPGTWGAPATPAPQYRSAVPPQSQPQMRSQQIGPRPEPQRAPAPMQSAVRPAQLPPPQATRPMQAPSAAPVQAARPAPAAVHVPQPSAPPPQAPRSAPEKPQPKRGDSDKPPVQQR